VSILLYIIVGVVALLVLVSIVLSVLGVGTGILQVFTFIGHALKSPPEPTREDTSWSRDQAREVGGPDDHTRSSPRDDEPPPEGQ
jgi:hypothetical protein